MICSLARSTKTALQSTAQFAHRAVASSRRKVAKEAGALDAITQNTSVRPADAAEKPKPAMISQIRGATLFDMATPGSCAAARDLAAYRARVATAAKADGSK